MVLLCHAFAHNDMPTTLEKWHNTHDCYTTCTACNCGQSTLNNASNWWLAIAWSSHSLLATSLATPWSIWWPPVRFAGVPGNKKHKHTRCMTHSLHVHMSACKYTTPNITTTKWSTLHIQTWDFKHYHSPKKTHTPFTSIRVVGSDDHLHS